MENREEWKIIESNPIYIISSLGRIRNSITGQFLKPTLHRKRGCKKSTYYLRIELKSPRKKYLVHRLVAEAFIENPYNYPQINHKNENGTHNDVFNLEWCEHKYNCEYSQAKAVTQFDLVGNIVGNFNSLSNAARFTGSEPSLISAVCLGKRRTHNKFIWKYS